MNIQQLRAQIAALQDATMDENKNFRSDYDEGKFDALSAVDALLDSMQEEPYGPNLAEKATKTPEKAFKQMESNSGPKDKCKGCNNVKGCITCVDGSEWAHYEDPVLSNVERTVKDWKEKPVSEELEKELSAYVNSKEYTNSIGTSGLLLIARHFANWQKHQDEKLLDAAEEQYFESREKVRKEVIEKAVDWLKSNIDCSMWIMDLRKYLEE